MTEQDDEHLRLLAVFHHVVGGLALVFCLFPALYLAFGVAMVTGRLPASAQESPPEWFGWVFVIVGLVFIAAALAFAVCLIMAGRCLARKRHYLFCMVIAALSCAFMPFGTVLGVFTLIVLSRPSVRQMFSQVPPLARPSSGS